MKCLLDTHFLLWITVRSPRLDAYPWLDDHRPWGVSPVLFLELQLLSDRADRTALGRVPRGAVGDERFVIDEVPWMSLVRTALPLDWTRDPFDRLLSAHSTTRRAPLCSVDRTMLRHHATIVAPLRTDRLG